jgi:hypothetical protein
LPSRITADTWRLLWISTENPTSAEAATIYVYHASGAGQALPATPNASVVCAWPAVVTPYALLCALLVSNDTQVVVDMSAFNLHPLLHRPYCICVDKCP